MKIEHSGKYNIVFTQDENNHRIPYTWTDENIPQNVLDYVAEHDLWNDEIKDLYAADYPEPTTEELAQQEQERINAESLAYLDSTDWYIIRLQETAKPIPQEILDNRQAARDAIV